MAVEQGALVLGDIGGYTTYLAGVELEHSHDVIADLLDTMVRAARGVLTLSKTEGDAVLWYRVGPPEGPSLIATTEAVYSAFRRRIRTIVHQTTCTCNACRQIPDLNLKLIAHAGEFVLRDIAGARELVGTDVIIAHRLLKNHVTEKHRVDGYAFLTDALLEASSLSIRDALPHAERYEDVGTIRGLVVDLDKRWREAVSAHEAYIPANGAATARTFTLRAPKSLVWDYLTDPRKRLQWGTDIRRIARDEPDEPLGVGSTNHCMHGAYTSHEEILDWAPFDTYTYTARIPLAVVRITCELGSTSDDATTVSWRIVPESAGAKLAMWANASRFWKRLARGMQTMERLAAKDAARAAERTDV